MCPVGAPESCRLGVWVFNCRLRCGRYARPGIGSPVGKGLNELGDTWRQPASRRAGRTRGLRGLEPLSSGRGIGVRVRPGAAIGRRLRQEARALPGEVSPALQTCFMTRDHGTSLDGDGSQAACGGRCSGVRQHACRPCLALSSVANEGRSAVASTNRLRLVAGEGVLLSATALLQAGCTVQRSSVASLSHIVDAAGRSLSVARQNALLHGL